MAEKESSRAKKGMGGGKKSSSKGKHPHETHIRHHKNGGHVVTHSFKNEDGSMEQGEPDVMADKAALMAHLQSTVPDNGAAQAAPPPDASAAVPPAAASPAPAAAAQPMPGA